jgi:hypothetical protein
MRIIEPLEAGNIYHIFNRGNNSEDIFKEKRNYYYFLEKYEEYCSPVLDTYTYNLLKNHFHLMVRVKEDVVVERRDGNGTIELKASTQLSHFFNCYTQSINKAYKRHGKLFEEPFKRIVVDNDAYLTTLIYYIHFNAQHHGFVKDFRDWEFSSWHGFLNDNYTFVEKSSVIEWFGNKVHFINAHLGNAPLQNISHLIIE